MVTGELGRAAVFQDDCVDDVAAETRHAPPPSCWSALCPATWVNYVVKSHTSGGTTLFLAVRGTCSSQLMPVGAVAESSCPYSRCAPNRSVGPLPRSNLSLPRAW